MNIAVAQSGGPTCAINASLVGVFSEALKEPSIDAIFGSINGIEGMIDDHLIDLKTMIRTNEDMEMLLQTPSTVLGSCRYKLKDWHDDDTVYQKIIHCFEQRQIGAFFYIGGNDSMDTVLKLSEYVKEKGLNTKIIGIPKTIDNDIYGTDVTFGFHTAVDIATDAIDRLHTTANSHSRILLCEIMGNKAGWLTLNAGIAGGADIILIPEIPYDIDKVCKSVLKRSESGKNFSIIAVAEGCFDKEEAKLKKKERARLRAEAGVITATNRIAAQIQQKTQNNVKRQWGCSKVPVAAFFI